MSFCVSSRRDARRAELRSTAIALGTLALFSWPAAEASAQSTVIVGGRGGPAVEVNLDVLDRLPETGGRFLAPGERPTDAVRLRAPGSGARSSASRAAPRPVPVPRLGTARQAAGSMPAAPPPRVTRRAVPPPTAPPPAPEALPPPKAQPAPPPAQAHRAERPERPKSPGRQAAALPRIPLPPVGGPILRIDFVGASTRLTPDAERRLASLAATMMESDGRLQLKAHAGGTSETRRSARRLSLSRALEVRSFLIEQGIRSTRIDVRALGRPKDDGPSERVDVVLLTR